MIFYTVAFNRPEFIDIQKKYLPGNLVVVNNGKNDLIKSKCQNLNIPCFDIENSDSDPSRSHGNALNFLKNIIDYTEDYCILDHDFFVYKKIDFHDYDIVSRKCTHGDRIFLWPGFFCAKKHVTLFDINFCPNQNGDTGTETHVLLNKYNVLFHNFSHLQKTNFTGLPQINVVLEKYGDFGIHFLNGSTWMPDINNVYQQKLEYLNNFLQQQIK